MKTCVIMQPTYMPWLGYFDLIDAADVFVFYDDVQFEKQSWQTRNRIKSHNNEVLLSLSVRGHSLNSQINEIEIDEKNPWKKKHLKAINYNYIKTPFFHEVYPFIEEIMLSAESSLSKFNAAIIFSICKKIGIDTELIFSSKLKSKEGKKDIRLVNICKELEATAYLSPLGSANYIESTSVGGAFTNSGVELFYQNFKHPIYSQIHSEFRPFMSVFDLLFNEGFSDSLQIIRSGRQKYLVSKELK